MAQENKGDSRSERARRRKAGRAAVLVAAAFVCLAAVSAVLLASAGGSEEVGARLGRMGDWVGRNVGAALSSVVFKKGQEQGALVSDAGGGGPDGPKAGPTGGDVVAGRPAEAEGAEEEGAAGAAGAQAVSPAEADAAVSKGAVGASGTGSGVTAGAAVLAENVTTEAVPERVDDGVWDYEALYPELQASRPKEWVVRENVVFLTFDDGPTIYTEQVLDTLREKGVSATFFVVGNSVRKLADGGEILNRVVNEGHTLGIHCDYHAYKPLYKSVETFLEDFSKIYNLIYELTGTQPDIFRFPGGSNTGYNKAIRSKLINEMERRGFTYYDWNASTGDSSSEITPESAFQNAVAKAGRSKRLIILIHDTKKASVDALPRIIDYYREAGYNFDRLINEDKPITL
ncbi:MAG: polysaccharide deacetylase [Clostridiales Family XIII bacterium]|jgi:peptidoglycan/xylan/chitin deacetylase (PgdA/CDA1 family)|nr:polysaccharide deacetylase [Clostridiales Family XIII bacterium]